MPEPAITQLSGPVIAIIWDPEVLSEQEYADLVEAVGDLVRSHGGLGIQLMHPQSFEAVVEEGVVL